jgi:hypothetical protein
MGSTASEANAPACDQTPSALEIVTLAATATREPRFRIRFADVASCGLVFIFEQIRRDLMAVVSMEFGHTGSSG